MDDVLKPEDAALVEDFRFIREVVGRILWSNYYGHTADAMREGLERIADRISVADHDCRGEGERMDAPCPKMAELRRACKGRAR